MDYNQKVFNKIINSKISRKYNIFSLSDSDKTKILDFDKKYGLTTDRVEFCCRCIANNCDLNETWDILKKYSSSSKEYHIAMYGYEQGMNLYKDRNKRKTKHFDFSSEKQKIRSKKRTSETKRIRKLSYHHDSILD